MIPEEIAVASIPAPKSTVPANPITDPLSLTLIPVPPPPPAEMETFEIEVIRPFESTTICGTVVALP